MLREARTTAVQLAQYQQPKLCSAVPVMARIMTHFMDQAEAEQRKDGGVREACVLPRA
jgi:hypothetical protein